ncbi:hypothetical protein BCAH187_E0012 (plasmid) [Bacillus cereus AH187]|uniref:Uncharacterized protein n=1 Tax=Bacillus cereus (strain AH187) TaxID=405534 RepID=B7I1M1_BACC7|nr:hypothetical protein BCAH187_E0012 [Bacillus cereus AH187]
MTDNIGITKTYSLLFVRYSPFYTKKSLLFYLNDISGNITFPIKKGPF